jgi:hypothetical protein
MFRFSFLIAALSCLTSTAAFGQDPTESQKSFGLYRSIAAHEMTSRTILPTRPEYLEGEIVVLDKSTLTAFAESSMSPQTNQRVRNVIRLTLPGAGHSRDVRTDVRPGKNEVIRLDGASDDGSTRIAISCHPSSICWGRIFDGGDVYVLMPMADGAHYVAKIDVELVRARKPFGRDVVRTPEELERLKREYQESKAEESEAEVGE